MRCSPPIAALALLLAAGCLPERRSADEVAGDVWRSWQVSLPVGEGAAALPEGRLPRIFVSQRSLSIALEQQVRTLPLDASSEQIRAELDDLREKLGAEEGALLYLDRELPAATLEPLLKAVEHRVAVAMADPTGVIGASPVHPWDGAEGPIMLVWLGSDGLSLGLAGGGENAAPVGLLRGPAGCPGHRWTGTGDLDRAALLGQMAGLSLPIDIDRGLLMAGPRAPLGPTLEALLTLEQQSPLLAPVGLAFATDPLDCHEGPIVDDGAELMEKWRIHIGGDPEHAPGRHDDPHDHREPHEPEPHEPEPHESEPHESEPHRPEPEPDHPPGEPEEPIDEELERRKREEAEAAAQNHEDPEP